MTMSIVGPMTWRVSRDSDSYRTYKLKTRVMGPTGCGPYTALKTPGLPLPGSYWSFVVQGETDQDLYAWCRWDAEVEQVYPAGEPGDYFDIEQTFSTKPPDTKSCKTSESTDPLLEPPKCSGSTVKYTEEASKDRFGRDIKYSSHERIRGAQVEFDANRSTVKIIQNCATFDDIALAYSYCDNVNDAPLWGFPARCVKLSSVSWDRLYYGSCSVYFPRTLEFDVNVKLDRYGAVTSGFDRDIMDEGNKALNGHWDQATGQWLLDNIAGSPPDRLNPAHFKLFVDRNGNHCRVILNGFGVPADAQIPAGTGTTTTVAGNIHVEKYNQVNMLALGIPLSF